jgi:dipeptidyl aminopeptidase/acylaminoacyl peptidase
MKKATANVEFIRLEKEDHNLSNSDTRYQALKAMVDFLKKYNPPN